MYIRGKKKNKIFVEEDSFLREISLPIFTSFGIVKTRRIVAREYFSQLRNELYYPSSKGALSYKVRAKATYKKLREGGRKRERERIKGGRGRCTRKSLGFFKCKARALKIQAKPLRVEKKFSFASRESGLRSSPSDT